MNTINKIISIVIALIATINIYAQKNIMDIHVYPQVSAGKTKQCIVTLVNQTNDSIVINNGLYPDYNSELQVIYYDDKGECISVDNARTGRGYIFTNSSNEKHKSIFFLRQKSSESFAFQYGERVDGFAQRFNIKKIEIELRIRYRSLHSSEYHYYDKTFTFDYWNAK